MQRPWLARTKSGHKATKVFGNSAQAPPQASHPKENGRKKNNRFPKELQAPPGLKYDYGYTGLQILDANPSAGSSKPS